MKLFTADFETTTDENDCRVWAYALSEIGDSDNFIYGTNLDEFFDFCANPKENYRIYFHNLKFDGTFILSWLFNNGFSFIEEKEKKESFTFTTLITDMGQFYSIEVYFRVKGHKTNKVTFLDSLKIFPNFSVERVADGFNLPLRKLKLDYKKSRSKNHKLTLHEIEYIKNDVTIMSMALDIMFQEGLNKMTIAGDAFSSFKEFNPDFRKIFPILDIEIDSDIRKSYKGGFTYANPLYTEKEVGSGLTLDVNSLYPAMMKKLLPFGEPEFFNGKYIKDPCFPLYIQQLTCTFKLKKGKIPSIQLHNNLSFMPNEYLESSKGEVVTLNLTSPDLELFFMQYDVDVISYDGGWKFKAKEGLFDSYIDYWTEQKIKAGKEGNAPKRQIAKLMLNSLYGRFGLNPISRKKLPYLNQDGIVKFSMSEPETRESVYIPVACFITAYGRKHTILTSQAVRDFSLRKYGIDKYLYSDTDSIHALLTEEDLIELKDIIKLDDFKLGFWAHEANFSRALFIRQKCYIEEINGKINVTVAGLPKYLTPIINFENFKKGFSTIGLSEEELKNFARENGADEETVEKLHHKLTYKYVKGGVILADTDFTII